MRNCKKLIYKSNLKILITVKCSCLKKLNLLIVVAVETKVKIRKLPKKYSFVEKL